MNNDLLVKTENGMVQGFETDGVNAWYGIPFGKAPVGELRFKHSKKADPWNDVKDCTTFGNQPIQFIGEWSNESEDCLNLNVWAPQNAENLPVFVWIYGGAGHFGYNDDANYNGVNMAVNGVVRVNLNYRLGCFGFYDFNQYDSELFDTNCALSDQILGLQWVRDNIAAFGGDPQNITIAGESAGGCAVFNLLASPAAKGLFQKAIIQSGLARGSGGREYTKTIIPVFLEYLGLKPEEAYKIKTMETSVLRKACADFYSNFSAKYAGIYMPGPFFGDDLLPDRIWTALQNGSAKDVDVIIGYNRDDGESFANSTESKKALFSDWNEVEIMLRNNKKEALFPELRAVYPDENEKKALSQFATDYLFAMDSHLCADKQTPHGNVWMYRFDFVPAAYKQMGMGAMHAAEVPFALNNTAQGFFSYSLKGTPQEQIDAIRDQINGAWLNFAKNGNPNGGIVDWSPYNSETHNVHVFDLEASNQKISVNPKVREVWDKLGLMYDQE